MAEFGCMEIVKEELPGHDGMRTLWDSLIGRLQFGDTIVIPKLSNALKVRGSLCSFWNCAASTTSV